MGVEVVAREAHIDVSSVLGGPGSRLPSRAKSNPSLLAQSSTGIDFVLSMYIFGEEPGFGSVGLEQSRAKTEQTGAKELGVTKA